MGCAGDRIRQRQRGSCAVPRRGARDLSRFELGPPIPYPPARRPDGNQNHGYVSTKGNPEAIASIPELHGWPEYEALIVAINSATGPTETVGCEKGFFDCDQGAAKIYLGSYTDVAFSNPTDSAVENCLRLASEIGRAMFGARNWWGQVQLGIQRMRVHDRLPDNGWGMMLKIIITGATPMRRASSGGTLPS